MYEFEYTNGFYRQEVNLIIEFISQELVVIKKNRKNLTTFCFSENIKGKLLFIDFQRIVNEIQRMAIEIDFLENKKLYYIKIKEKQELK